MLDIVSYNPSSNTAFCVFQNELQPIFYYKEGINRKILLNIFSQLDDIVSRQSKTAVIFLQLHQGKFTKENSEITAFLKSFKKDLCKKYGDKLGYAWVREQDKAPAQHYHLAMFLDGQKCKSAYNVQIIAQELWNKRHPRSNSFRVTNPIYRIDNSEKGRHEHRAARTRLSYFAKNHSKQFDANVNKYGCWSSMVHASDRN